MTSTTKPVLTVEALINAPKSKVWQTWTDPQHIAKWNTAVPEWHCPHAEHDLKAGGKFSYRMEARDGSFGFDFSGVFDLVEPEDRLEYTIADGRKVKIKFTATGSTTQVSESFEAESENPLEMQQGGWQAILNNFKNYVETL